jgi:hypothetical protein
MGIDGIGKKGGIPELPNTNTNATDKTRSAKFGNALATERGAGAQKTTATAQVGSSELSAVREGRISLDSYLDQKVDKAVAGVSGLPKQQLEDIRRTLRAELMTDPDLAKLASKATGQTMPAADE